MVFGYGSPFGLDELTFSLCDNCLVDWLKEFKHPPQDFSLQRSRGSADEIVRLDK